MSDIKRTWSVPTSPRTPYKMCDEVKLLGEFEGQEWNRVTQGIFAERLAESDFFEGTIYKREPDFSARDRINRAPTTFGFIRFDNDNLVQITDAGRQLIGQVRLDELFLRQLLKWQYPSPQHSGAEYAGFRIKPFLELLRLANELDGLSKKEIAIFCLPFIDFRNYRQVKTKIIELRNTLDSLSAIEKKRFIIDTHINLFREVYRREVRQGTFRLRERRGRTVTAEDFIKTKVRNSNDYADAAIRYFRATGIFTISGNTYRLRILESKKEIVRQILRDIPRIPKRFERQESKFLNYLCNPEIPILPQDNIVVIINEVLYLARKIQDLREAIQYSRENLMGRNLSELKDIRYEMEQKLKLMIENKQIQILQTYDLYEDVIEIFEKIQDRTDTDISDKPLFFEWNTWRAFNMLDDGEIKGNLSLDTDGRPLSIAVGRLPDMVCFYINFVLVVEVTLSTGETQFRAEGESVPRHLGDIVRSLRAGGDDRPVFGIFLARSLSQSTIAHFYSLRRTTVEFYGGRAKIVPFDLTVFKQMLFAAKQANGITSDKILSFLEWVENIAGESANETEWYTRIKDKAAIWLNN